MHQEAVFIDFSKSYLDLVPYFCTVCTVNQCKLTVCICRMAATGRESKEKIYNMTTDE